MQGLQNVVLLLVLAAGGALSNNNINNSVPDDGGNNNEKGFFDFFITSSERSVVNNNTNQSVAMESMESTTSVVFLPTVSGQVDDLAPSRAGFWEWLLSIIGIRPTPPEEPQEPPADCQQCNCGLTYHRIRIVNGMETKVNEYPWMAYLRRYNSFYCGASLINDRYVLTAAHCAIGMQESSLSVVLLDHDRNTLSETKTITRKISKIMTHKLYNSGGQYNNDIALLQLEHPVPTHGLLKPVCLPEPGRDFAGEKAIVTGWGTTAEGGSVSGKLMEVEVPILSNKECRNTSYRYKITDNMLCAGYLEGGKDACQGDSGGPLHLKNGTKNHIVGIVSWGEGCAQKNYPGVYSRVNRFLTWIKSNTRNACHCT